MYQHMCFILKANNFIQHPIEAAASAENFTALLIVNTETPATQRNRLFRWDNKSIIIHFICFSCSIKRKHMTSRVEFLFPDAQIPLLMQFSEVPIPKNDFFFLGGWGGGWRGWRPLLLIATFLYLTINAPSFGQVWNNDDDFNSSTSTKWFLVFHCS